MARKANRASRVLWDRKLNNGERHPRPHRARVWSSTASAACLNGARHGQPRTDTARPGTEYEPRPQAPRKAPTQRTQDAPAEPIRQVSAADDYFARISELDRIAAAKLKASRRDAPTAEGWTT